MKTDTLFYRLFQSFPSLFFELIQLSPAEAGNYQFASVEVKQLAFRIDGVLLPKPAAAEPLIYFSEVQFQVDTKFYGRFFGEIFLYLSNTDLPYNWQGAVIYPNRQIECQKTERYQELLDSGRVQRIYLEELGEISEMSPELATVKLIVTPETEAMAAANSLIHRVRQELEDEIRQRELLQLIETVLIYKLPQMTRQELEAMFTVSDLKQTKIYQEALEEGKLESVPFMLQLGATVEQIAQALDLPLEKVREVAQQQHNR